MKFRQVIKILKKPNWAIDINSMPIDYHNFGKFYKGYFTVENLFTFNKISRKELLNGLKQAKTIYIWGYGKYTKLVLKMMKYYENKGKLIDENDETLQRLIAKAKAEFKDWANRLRMIRG